jgi:hypothetical protein
MVIDKFLIITDKNLLTRILQTENWMVNKQFIDTVTKLIHYGRLNMECYMVFIICFIQKDN